MDYPKVFTELLALTDAPPTAATANPAAPPLTKMSQAAANQAMWLAIDQADDDLFEQAIAQGASFRNRRENRTAFHETILRGQFAQMRRCLSAGADLNVTLPSHESVVSLLASRDDPAEFDILTQEGFDPAAMVKEVLQDVGHPSTHRLALRAVRAVGVDALAKHARQADGEAWAGWAGVALLNPNAGVDWMQVLRTHKDAANKELWKWLQKVDDPSLAAQALRWSWLPPEVFVAGQTEPPLGLRMLTGGSPRLFSWFMRHPDLLDDTSRRSSSFIHFFASLRPADLDTAKKAGVNFLAQHSSGANWAHCTLSAYNPSKSMVLWWMKNVPEALQVADQSGRPPINYLQPKEIQAWAAKTMADAEKKTLRKGLAPDRPSVSTVPPRRRL